MKTEDSECPHESPTTCSVACIQTRPSNSIHLSCFHIMIPDKMDAPTSSATETATAPREPNLVGASPPKAIIKNVDMSEEMQQESVDIASAALEKYNIEKDIAAQIKKEFDRRHGPTWHVVVGKNFGSYVTHGMSLVPSFFFFFFPIGPKNTLENAFLESKSMIFAFFFSLQVENAHLSVFLLISIPRNQTLYLFLRRHPCHPHLEIMNRPCTTLVLSWGQGCGLLLSKLFWVNQPSAEVEVSRGL